MRTVTCFVGAAILALAPGYAGPARAQSGELADIPQSFQWHYAYPPAGWRYWSRGGSGWTERYPDGRQNSFEVLRPYTVIGPQYTGACRGVLLRKLPGATQESVTEVFIPNRQCTPQNLIFRLVEAPTSNWIVAGRMEQISYATAPARPPVGKAISAAELGNMMWKAHDCGGRSGLTSLVHKRALSVLNPDNDDYWAYLSLAICDSTLCRKKPPPYRQISCAAFMPQFRALRIAQPDWQASEGLGGRMGNAQRGAESPRSGPGRQITPAELGNMVWKAKLCGEGEALWKGRVMDNALAHFKAIEASERNLPRGQQGYWIFSERAFCAVYGCSGAPPYPQVSCAAFLPRFRALRIAQPNWQVSEGLR